MPNDESLGGRRIAGWRNRAERGVEPCERPLAMPKSEIVPWMVEFACTDVEALAQGPPGDLPNLLYRLRTWLDLEPDEPLNGEVAQLQARPSRLKTLVAKVRGLLEAVADRSHFEVRYASGGAILEASKLAAEGGRALSYRDANLADAVIRVALDDIYEDAARALRIKRCSDLECKSLFFAKRPDQDYCNHRCASRMASRRFRRRHAAQRAEDAHRRYKAKVRALYPNAVVRRIPRKHPRD